MLLKVILYYQLCLFGWLGLCSQTPFNVDLRFPILLPSNAISKELNSRNPSFPSLFGSSIVVTSTNKTRHNVFIGSPNLFSKTNSALMTGGVYRCTIETDQIVRISCNEINLKNAKIYETNQAYVPKNKSLIGFSLGKTYDSVIVCAPNWVGKDDTPEGLCFTLNSNSGKSVFAFKYPMQNLIKSNRPFESHNLFGFSNVFNKDNGELIFGIPGYIDFGGSVCTVNRDFQTTKFKGLKSKVNTYLGYAVEWYSFDGLQAIVAGSPRHNNFNGKVDLIDIDSQNVIYSLLSKNDTKGEYFGSSLLVTDVTGDKKGDILVGAPYYSVHGKREIGRVYLYQNLMELMYRRHQPQIILSRHSKVGARFGTNLASIDINLDQFYDVIISAPFEPNIDGSTGAIYVYYGTPNGLDISSEKRIGAEVISKSILMGFGFSLWTQTDFDNNGYNDLVVGSIISETAFILRTIPILNFNITIEFDRKGINLTDYSQCQRKNACFRVFYCIVTNSEHSFPKDLSFSVNFTISDRKLRLKENRVTVNQQNSIIQTKFNQICLKNEDAFYVEVKNKEDIYDIITPIEVQLSVLLQTPKLSNFCSVCPIANAVTVYKEIGFEHGCATKHCIANLDLKVDFKYGPNQVETVITQGQFNSLDFTARIANHGESSIDTMLLIWIRPKILTLLNNADSFRCTLDVRQNIYICDINKLLQKDQKEELILRFDMSNLVEKTMLFEVRLNSSSVISKESVVHYAKNVSVTKDVSFNLIGNPFYNYSFSERSSKVIFPISLVVEKIGPSMVNGTFVQFYLPNNIVEIEQSLKYRCTRIQFHKIGISKSLVTNHTLDLLCGRHGNLCSKYECNLNRFENGYHSVNFDLTLAFYPSRIPSKLNEPYASISTEFIFERQINEIKSKFSPLIMFGGAGVGLLILLITTIILIKYGFFKRKKRDELRRVKQRMSMSPNLAIPAFNENIDNESDSETKENEPN